jgi:lipoprotein-anchoring transpeptidase ErfK/SrfK
MRARSTLIAITTAFLVMSATGATLAEPGTPLLPVSTDVDASASAPGIEIARPATPQLLPFESPAAAYAGMGRDARAAARPAPSNSGEGKRIVYTVRGQRVWLVEADGTVLDTYLVSGRKNLPGPGTYHVYSKSTHARALYGGITMKYMVRFTRGPNGIAIGFHDLPRYPGGRPMQTTAQLGTYQSGGCVRQDRAHAVQLYEWAPIGTKVVVLR